MSCPKFSDSWSKFSGRGQIIDLSGFLLYNRIKNERIGIVMKRSLDELDTRQMPCRREVTSEKNYCDLLYAWLQCNSERVTLHSRDRQIEKKRCQFTNIEREMTDSQGNKVMSRKTISKYFHWLEDQGYIIDEEGKYYKLRLLQPEEANIIYYKTLSILTNVLKQHVIDIYQYLYGRFCANEKQPYIVTVSQMKDYIGIATTTTSNNAIVMDPLEILCRLQLLDFEYIQTEEKKTNIQINWVVDRLPDIQK